MKYLFFLGAFWLSSSLFSQVTEWSKMPSVGAYFTPLKHNRYSASSGLSPNEKFFENTYSLMFSAPITQRFRLGAQYFLVSTHVIREPVDRAHLFGLVGQFNLRPRRPLGVYLEGGYTFGNFCPCGDAEPYTSDTLQHFRNLGLGVDYRFSSRWHLKADFVNYQPIQKLSAVNIYNWTQPFIGLNYYFFPRYRTPFKSRFRREAPPLPKNQRQFLWKDPKRRTWNIGVTTAGVSVVQHQPRPDQQTPLLRYFEFIVVPRVNYWVNQSLMLGAQLSYYHLDNNLSVELPHARGWGVGIQARFYPLALNKRDEFRAIRLGKRALWHFSPIAGVELRWSNYSWLEPERAGQAWQYYDVHPHIGYGLSYRRWLNFFALVGPTYGVGHWKTSTPVNGVAVIGLEYHFTKNRAQYEP